MDQAEWTAAHVEAFAFFGGVPARLVPENVPRNIFRVLCPPALCGRGDPLIGLATGLMAACG
jgi:transposase